LHGIINIYKEKGYTSFDVVAIIRKTLKIKKVGHTGTLDPDAEGVLPVCIGNATKVVDLLTDKNKTYKAVVHLGITTDTGDKSGKILSNSEVLFDEEKIIQAVNSFKGEYFQIPPMYSALKVNGKKLYQYAREGITIEREKRKIYIYDIKIIEFLPPDKFEIEVNCSKGTYIRTLCEDIGNILNCGAYMYSLVRTNVGNFSLNDSIKIEDFKKYVNEKDIDKYILKVEDIFLNLPKVIIKESANKYVLNGNKLYEDNIEFKIDNLIMNSNVRVYDYNDKFIGIYKVLKEEYILLKPEKLFFNKE